MGWIMKISPTGLSFSSVVLAATALLLLASESTAADWRLVRQSSYGDSSYYDAASVKRLGGRVVSVRARLGAGEYQYEMRCGDKQARLLETVDGGSDESNWFPIVNGTDEELIYEAVCP
jgi:hypothetical protein